MSIIHEKRSGEIIVNIDRYSGNKLGTWFEAWPENKRMPGLFFRGELRAPCGPFYFVLIDKGDETALLQANATTPESAEALAQAFEWLAAEARNHLKAEAKRKKAEAEAE